MSAEKVLENYPSNKCLERIEITMNLQVLVYVGVGEVEGVFLLDVGVGVGVVYPPDPPFEDWAGAHLALGVGAVNCPHFVFGVFVGHSHLLTRRAWLELDLTRHLF